MKRKTIKLIYWKDVPNFGDYIGPFLVEKITGFKTIYKRRWWGYKAYFKEIYRIFRYRQWNDLPSLTHPFEKTLLTVGSILKYANPGAIVWGSGFMSEKDKLSTKCLYVKAVRGCISASKLGGGISLGDPALLIPLYVSQSKVQIHQIGIIPHWSEYDFFKQINFQNLHIIDPRTNDVAKIVDDITCCKYILSSSLHGLIIAHAYGIPAIWIRNTEFDDRFKFHDYFSAIKIEKYEPVKIIRDNILLREDFLLKLFLELENVVKPQELIVKEIQNNLMKCFPFKEFKIIP